MKDSDNKSQITNHESNKEGRAFFIGIGGIGMSALARYYHHQGWSVSGYDRVGSEVSEALENEGIHITFEDTVNTLDPTADLVIYTPAIPSEHKQLNWYRSSDFKLLKRAQALGEITANHQSICCAGTHGKTSTSSLLTALLQPDGAGAFLGGILKKGNTNFYPPQQGQPIVVEADEFDRSFLNFHPDIALVTSTDADHLDIYGKGEELEKTFEQFAQLVPENGHLILEESVLKSAKFKTTVWRYGFSDSNDFQPKNIRVEDGKFHFDLVTPWGELEGWQLPLPGRYNVLNATAAIAAAMAADSEFVIRNSELMHKVDAAVDGEVITLTNHESQITNYKSRLAEFAGIKRRFEIHINSPKLTYVDDYAHHPSEIDAFVAGLRELYPGKKLTGIFQPHLFSRTRDFMDGFAKSLAQLDELLLMDIYPAREKPIDGVNSTALLEQIPLKNKQLVAKENLLEVLKTKELAVLATIGAGDIDRQIVPITQLLKKQNTDDESGT